LVIQNCFFLACWPDSLSSLNGRLDCRPQSRRWRAHARQVFGGLLDTVGVGHRSPRKSRQLLTWKERALFGKLGIHRNSPSALWETSHRGRDIPFALEKPVVTAFLLSGMPSSTSEREGCCGCVRPAKNKPCRHHRPPLTSLPVAPGILHTARVCSLSIIAWCFAA
jgi:hypothetical protein